MPARLPQEIRLQVVQLYIQGYSIEFIATRLNIAPQSARNIVEELKRGDYPEYETFLAHLDDIRTLSRILRSKKRSLQQAIVGITVFDALNEIGIEPVELKEQLQLFQRIAPPDFPIAKFAKAARRILRLESDTGLSFEALEAKIPRLMALIADLETKRKNLDASVLSLESAKEEASQNFERSRLENGVRLKKEIQEIESSIGHLRSEKEKQLTNNRVTAGQIASYVSIRERLAKKGFDIEKLGVPEKIVDQLSKYGWNAAKIINYLEQIKGLEQQTEIARTELATVQEKLEVTNQELRDATAKVAQAQKDLEGLELLENESRERTAQSEIKMEKNNLRLDLADTILALLNDASKVKDDQLLGIAEKLQQVVKTRKNLLGLPVDYQALRDRLLLWVETLLGKKLVTRESVDELTRKYGDLVGDVQLDRLGKLEALRHKQGEERLQLLVERASSEKAKEAFANSSTGELLALAASRMKSGDFHVFVCVKCRYRVAYEMGSGYGKPLSHCSRCYNTLKRVQLVKVEA